jgi:perosamine synthetase
MNFFLYKNIEKNIFSVIKKKNCLHEPFFIGNEEKYLRTCIKENIVGSPGLFFDKFKEKLKKFTKSNYVVLVNSGTSALHLSLIASGLKRNEEVLMPTLNYIASANATIYCGAIPHFIDIDKSTLGVDPLKLQDYLNECAIVKKGLCFNKKTKRIIRALICLHTFGHPTQIDKIKSICKKFKIILIEDAAEALGSFYKSKHLGTFGSLGVISFNGNKIITSGCGGAILTNNSKFFKFLTHISQTGKIPHAFKYEYKGVGYNYRLPNLNSALGLAQLENINFFIKQKRKLFCKYDKVFRKIKGIKIFKEPKYAKSNYWLQTIILEKSNSKILNQLIKYLNKKNIGARPVWQLLHKVKHLKKYPKSNLNISEEMSNRIINIPSSAFI